MRRLPNSRLLVLAFAIATPSVSEAQPRYMDPHPPARIALVIGDSSYEHIARLPSANVDAELMTTKLKALSFAVMTVPGIRSLADFWGSVLPSFVEKVAAGDIVFVYFSGHGFSYKSHNWLAPLNLRDQVAEEDVVDAAVSVENIGSAIAKKHPGILTFVIDACRVIRDAAMMKDFAVIDSAGVNRIGKGMVEDGQFLKGIDNLVGYASDMGTTATGNSASGKASAFTEVFVTHMDAGGLEFPLMFRDVAGEVSLATPDTQTPHLQQSLRTVFYVNPTEENRSFDRSLWTQMTQASNKRRAIAQFAVGRALSDYAWAARKWLEDYPESKDADRFTFVSPEAIERAWDSTAKAITVQPIRVGLAFDRNIDRVLDEDVHALSNLKLGLKGQTSAASKRQADVSALQAHKTAFTTKDFAGRRAPSTSAEIKVHVSPSTKVSIVDVLSNDDQWLAVNIPGLDSLVYLRISDVLEVVPVKQLGTAQRELLVPALDKIKGALDTLALMGEIERLKKARKDIKWVSMTTGVPADSADAIVKQLLLVQGENTLKNSGIITGLSITSVQGNKEVAQNGVRFRFFGWDP